jgi:cytochrome c553
MKYVVFIIALLFLTGCDTKEENKETTKSTKQATAQSINVVQNATKIEKENAFVTYDINGNQVVNIAPSGEEETPVTKEIGALATIRTSYEAVNANLISMNLSKNYIVKCSSCHDDYANGVVGPSLLHKSADEIADKIRAYKNLTQVNVLMKYLVSQMDDEEIESLAKEIAQLNKELMEAKNE